MPIRAVACQKIDVLAGNAGNFTVLSLIAAATLQDGSQTVNASLSVIDRMVLLPAGLSRL